MNNQSDKAKKEALKGVYIAGTASGRILYRASLTKNGRHISLGSYPTEKKAHLAYEEASKLLENNSISLNDFQVFENLAFEKAVILINYRDNGLYFGTPIYLRKEYFNYYLDHDRVFTFDLDDLFYFSSHKITARGGHYFVADYGSQVSIGSRFGLKPYSVVGRDCRFINSDPFDYRRENLEITNTYHGVIPSPDGKGYIARLHTSGYTKIGTYDSALEAAIAYNKALDIVKKRPGAKNFPENYIDEVSGKVYAEIYNSVSINLGIK
ncbi:MAG: hypothetical protein K5871_01765 [Lachnospiraceae bacterium]|nr:hypothetical protein [Lachnospiraceae bacterium]